MGQLFEIQATTVDVLIAKPFAQEHTEADLQHWADQHPHLLNEGRPMVSLGREIETTHAHYIDNLYLDGNGKVVVAELKRGRSPRDVTAQAIDYAAFAQQLTWEKLDDYCQQRQGVGIEEAYQNCFGRPLVKTEEPQHRLLIVAEDFDDRVISAATYLLNAGVPLALLAFAQYLVGSSKMLDVQVVLGEIPPETSTAGHKKRTAATSTVDEGVKRWLLTSLEAAVPEIEKQTGLDLATRSGSSTFTFAPVNWPLELNDCKIWFEVFTHQCGLSFVHKPTKAPDLKRQLEATLAEGSMQASELRLNEGSQFVSLSRLFPMPEIGDSSSLDEILDAILAMIALVDPIVMDIRTD